MAVLAPETIAGVVKVVGPPRGTTAAEWVAKAMQESSGDTDIADHETGTHWGLWQIGEIHAGTHGSPAGKAAFIASMKNPVANFVMAKALYEESGWRPWAASGGKPTTNASHERAVANSNVNGLVIGGTNPLTNILGDAADALSPVTDPLEALAGGVKDAVEILISAGAWVADPHNWTRIALVGLGGALAVVAAAIVIAPQVKEASPL